MAEPACAICGSPCESREVRGTERLMCPGCGPTHPADRGGGAVPGQAPLSTARAGAQTPRPVRRRPSLRPSAATPPPPPPVTALPQLWDREGWLATALGAAVGMAMCAALGFGEPPVVEVADGVTVELHTAPTGADVLIAGELLGQTPLELTLQPGRHRVGIANERASRLVHLKARRNQQHCFREVEGRFVEVGCEGYLATK